MTKEDEIKEIKRLCGKTSFRAADMVILRNLYLKYIHKRAAICLSCPSSLRHYIKIFKDNKDNMIKKIEE